MSRIGLAFRAFWKCLNDDAFARGVEQVERRSPAGADVRILALLQRDGRLVDFLQEDIDGYSDAQVGAAVRDIHRGCRKALREYLAIEPVYSADEGQSVTVGQDFDPAEIQLTGNVVGPPPFRGVLKHHGWRVKAVQLPAVAVGKDQSPVLAPAEVEVG